MAGIVFKQIQSVVRSLSLKSDYSSPTCNIDPDPSPVKITVQICWGCNSASPTCCVRFSRYNLGKLFPNPSVYLLCCVFSFVWIYIQTGPSNQSPPALYNWLPAIHWNPHPQSSGLSFAQSRMYCFTQTDPIVSWTVPQTQRHKKKICVKYLLGFNTLFLKNAFFSILRRKSTWKAYLSVRAHQSRLTYRMVLRMPHSFSRLCPLRFGRPFPVPVLRCPPEPGVTTISPCCYSHMLSPMQLRMLQ